MDEINTCSGGLRDLVLGKEDVLSSPSRSIISSPSIMGTPMVAVVQVHQPQSPQTMVGGNTQLDLTLLDQAQPRREPSPK